MRHQTLNSERGEMCLGMHPPWPAPPALALTTARANGRHLLLVLVRGRGLAGRDPRPLEPDAAGGSGGAAASFASALLAPPGDLDRDRRPGRTGHPRHRGRPLRLRRQLQQSRRQQHLRPRLPTRGPRHLAGLQLPPRRRRRSPLPRPCGDDRDPGSPGRRRLVGPPPGTHHPDRPRRRLAPLPRLPPLRRRLLPGQGPDDRGSPGDARDRPPPTRGIPPPHRPGQGGSVTRHSTSSAARCVWGWTPLPAPQATGMDPSRGCLHRRRRLLHLPGPARRPRRTPRARLRATGIPADPARPARPLRRPGPLRRLRAAGRGHPRAPGRVPRRCRLAERREAVRHRRRLQPDRLRLLLTRHPRPLPVRDHQPRRLEQQAATELQAGGRDLLLRALEADRGDAGGPPRPPRGNRGRGVRRLRGAGGPDPCSPTPAAPRSSPAP